MHRHASHPGSQSPRNHQRKEWGQFSDQEHQMEAREHARVPVKARRAEAARSDEAERQIRELRGRY